MIVFDSKSYSITVFYIYFELYNLYNICMILDISFNYYLSNQLKKKNYSNFCFSTPVLICSDLSAKNIVRQHISIYFMYLYNIILLYIYKSICSFP